MKAIDKFVEHFTPITRRGGKGMRNYAHKVTCWRCKCTTTLMLNEDGYAYWCGVKGRKTSVQDIFFYLTADERELLRSGTCGECYDYAWGGVE